MKIVVLVKEVPDTYGQRVLDEQTGLADRAASGAVLDEIDERALEVALSYADEHDGTEIVALSMGPASSEPSIRKALAMGADSAVLVADEALRGADLVTTAEVLAAAVRRIGFDLVVAGDRSTDGASGAVPAAIAEFLQVPSATSLSTVGIDEGRVAGTRATASARLTVEAATPCVISITEALPDPRFPSLKSAIAARRKPLMTLSVSDLGVAIEDETRAHSIVLGVARRPERVAGLKLVDEGDAAGRLVDFLADSKLL